MTNEQPGGQITEAELRGFAENLVAWAGTLAPSDRAVLGAILRRGAPAAAGDVSGFTATAPNTESEDDVAGFFFFTIVQPLITPVRMPYGHPLGTIRDER